MQSYGYRYLLQTDDDAFLAEPLLSNLVELMESGSFQMAARDIKFDDASVLWGLAELAKYFILTEVIYPSSLFSHCNPPDMTGLFST